MIFFKKLIFTSVLFFGILTSGFTQEFEKEFDQLLNEQYTANEPGATALVAVKGEIIYHKAFGMANMELDVKNKPEMVFEIASITKQFTAVSILMLMEQGKLKLNDDITKYIEDYPTHGHEITIHHLLTHTSGIKSYTSMEKWVGKWREDYDPVELIDFFKNEPMDFAPGEMYEYNNSAYFILGYIIEKVSGQTYEDFIENEIFKALGMNSSYYGSHKDIIKNRAYGYQKNDTIVNAEYLSMTQPYSAGSIMSTVEDLFIWNRALVSDKLVKEETIDLAFTNYTLNNGDSLNYGYGWGLNEINGSATIEHAGGIFGYSTNAIFLPDEDVFVAILSNADFIPSTIVSTKMAALAIQKPFPTEKDMVQTEQNILERLVGVYEFEDGTTRIITLDDDKLYSQRTGGKKFWIYPVEGRTWWYEDSFATIEFYFKNDDISAVFTNRIDKTSGVKTNKSIP